MDFFIIGLLLNKKSQMLDQINSNYYNFISPKRLRKYLYRNFRGRQRKLEPGKPPLHPIPDPERTTIPPMARIGQLENFHLELAAGLTFRLYN